MRLKLKLKKIPTRRQQKKWKLDSLVTKVELFRKDIEEVQCFRQGTTEERWENLKGAVMKTEGGRRKCGILERKSCQKTMDNDSHNGEDAREKEEQEYRGRQKNIGA